MKSGISRYTLGAFNQTALDDVYNKAKEIYTAPVEPPSSGVIVNTTDIIWNDMEDAPTGYPVASNLSYGQIQGPVFTGRLNTQVEGWGKTNAWFEVEEMTCEECPEWNPDTIECGECSCGFTISQSTNTAVEMTPMWLSWRDGNTWRELQNGTGTLAGYTHPTASMLFQTNRGCNVTAIENIRDEYKGYDVHIGAVGQNELYVPKHYLRYHGWAGSYPTDRTTIQAIYVAQYARLVLIDPNGVDDRHLARFCMHVSSDLKAADGTQVPGAEGWGVGGLSRYKMLPTNGDWMPCNFIDGWIDEADFIANPPNFPTEP